jgi:phage shock protein PspC (stress-responsive transcriptional regulator)
MTRGSQTGQDVNMPSSRPNAVTNPMDPASPLDPPRTEPPSSETSVNLGHKRIMRSRESKVFAGVAGGLGRHFGIDPVIIRVALVVLVLTTSGVFFLLYIAAIFIIPKEPKRDLATIRTEPGGGSMEISRSSLGAAVLIGIGLLALSDQVGLNFDGEFLWPLAFIGFGIAVLWSRRSPNESTSGSNEVNEGNEVYEVNGSTGANRVANYDPADESHPFRTLVDSPIVQRAYDRVAEPLTPAKPAGLAGLAVPARAVRAVRPGGKSNFTNRSPYSTIATAGFFVAVGLSWLLLRIAHLHPSPRPALGGVLAIIGVLLVFGSWLGRPKLVTVGVVLTLFLGVTASAGVRLNGGVGERNLILSAAGLPAKSADVPTANYKGALTQKRHLDVGALMIDTRSISDAATLAETMKNPHRYDVGIGVLTIVVAPNVNLLLNAKVGGGNLSVDGVEVMSGMDQSTARTIPATKPPTEGKVRTLRVDARVGLGAVVVKHADANVSLAAISENLNLELEGNP